MIIFLIIFHDKVIFALPPQFPTLICCKKQHMFASKNAFGDPTAEFQKKTTSTRRWNQLVGQPPTSLPEGVARAKKIISKIWYTYLRRILERTDFFLGSSPDCHHNPLPEGGGGLWYGEPNPFRRGLGKVRT